MSRYELWLCMWIALITSKRVNFIYVGIFDTMCTLHKYSCEGVLRVVYLKYELNKLWLML